MFYVGIAATRGRDPDRRVSHLRLDPAEHVPLPAHRARERRAGDDLPADQRLPELDAVVALRAPRSRAEAHLLGCRPPGAARSMPGKATRMSAPGAWRSSTRHRTRSSSSSTSSRRSRRTTSPSSRSSRRATATDVTWAMHGPVPFIGKIMHLLIDCDKMVGKDFATGLENMKAVAERPQSSAA